MYVFLLEDVPNFVPYVLSTGYTELRLELKHCLTYHGTDKAWKPYIRSLKKRVKDFEVRYKLTKRQIDSPLKTIGRGPTPGGLLKLLKTNRQNWINPSQDLRLGLSVFTNFNRVSSSISSMSLSARGKGIC